MTNLLQRLGGFASGWRLLQTAIGTIISAIGVIVFLIPSQIAPGGVSGIAIILHEVIGTPVGIMTLIFNIPIQIFAYRVLGGSWLIISTIFSVVIFSASVDILPAFVSTHGVSENDLLNAIFGGIVGGIGSGLIYGAGATAGGTATLSRILQHRMGIPLSSAYLYTDTLIIGMAGLVFGWEAAMYAIVSLFISGMVADYVLEGPSVIRTVTIVTDYPQEVSKAILGQLGRGVTSWEGMGMFTDQPHTVLFVTIARPQVATLRHVVFAVDPKAFVVIGQGHVAYGRGFKSAPIPKADS